jgi:hypothetical protein
LPASSIRLVSLSLSASEITGGNSVTGTVSLNGLAKAGGFPVSLRSNLPALPVPTLVAVSQGQVSATFTISTQTTNTLETATLMALDLASGSTQTATLQIDPAALAQLSAFTVAPSTVQGGTSLTGTLELTERAAFGGIVVSLSSDNAVVQPPASVAIQGNSTTTTFTIPTTAVSAPQAANLTATLGNTTLTAQATVAPALQLTLSESSVTGGSSVTATVTLGKAAPASGAIITIASGDITAAQTPGTVTIAAGQTSATFTVTTNAVTAARTATITVTYAAAGGLLSQFAMLTVNPVVPGQLQSLTVTPTQVTGGAGATATITLTGPAPIEGLIVQVKTSSILVAQVPSLVTVPQGQTTAMFPITTTKVALAQTVTVTATAGNVSETATLTVN